MRYRAGESPVVHGLVLEITTDKPIVGEPFVDVPTVGLEPPAATRAPAAAVLTLTRQAGDGSTLSIQGELSPGQWRWALALLQEAGR